MPEAKKEQVLSVRDLDITFKTTAGPVHAIRGVNIDLYKGETVALVGESGSGKSVTMKAAMGILAQNAIVNSGSIQFSYHQVETEHQQAHDHDGRDDLIGMGGEAVVQLTDQGTQRALRHRDAQT